MGNPEMTNVSSKDFKAPGLSRVSTGVEGLDEVLVGGLLQGGFYLLQGDPGSAASGAAKCVDEATEPRPEQHARGGERRKNEAFEEQDRKRNADDRRGHQECARPKFGMEKHGARCDCRIAIGASDEQMRWKHMRTGSTCHATPSRPSERRTERKSRSRR